MENWIPKPVDYAGTTTPKQGTRPWITLHSVRNLINSFKWKRRKITVVGKQLGEKNVVVDSTTTYATKANEDEWEIVVRGGQTPEEVENLTI